MVLLNRSRVAELQTASASTVASLEQRPSVNIISVQEEKYRLKPDWRETFGFHKTHGEKDRLIAK